VPPPVLSSIPQLDLNCEEAKKRSAIKSYGKRLAQFHLSKETISTHNFLRILCFFYSWSFNCGF